MKVVLIRTSISAQSAMGNWLAVLVFVNVGRTYVHTVLTHSLGQLTSYH